MTLRRNQCVGGFTLVEMLLVVVFLSILTGMVIVSLAGRPQAHALDASAKDLAAAIEFAASEMARSSRPHRLSFLQGKRSYCVEVMALDEQGGYRPVAGSAGRPHALAEGVSIDAILPADDTGQQDPEALEFRPGSAGFCGRVRLRNDAGEQVELEILRGTGQVVVHRE